MFDRQEPESVFKAAAATDGPGAGDGRGDLLGPFRQYEQDDLNRTPARHAGKFTTTPTRSTAMKTMETVETKKAKHISRRFRRFVRANEAVSALEYAILVGVIAVAVAAALATFSTDLTTAIEKIGDRAAAVDTGKIK